jgi:hypothetical protein
VEATTAEDATVEVTAKRVQWDSSLAEALECRKRQDEMSDRRSARCKECVKLPPFGDGAGPSDGQ